MRRILAAMYVAAEALLQEAETRIGDKADGAMLTAHEIAKGKAADGRTAHVRFPDPEKKYVAAVEGWRCEGTADGIFSDIAALEKIAGCKGREKKRFAVGNLAAMPETASGRVLETGGAPSKRAVLRRRSFVKVTGNTAFRADGRGYDLLYGHGGTWYAVSRETSQELAEEKCRKMADGGFLRGCLERMKERDGGLPPVHEALYEALTGMKDETAAAAGASEEKAEGGKAEMEAVVGINSDGFPRVERMIVADEKDGLYSDGRYCYVEHGGLLYRLGLRGCGEIHPEIRRLARELGEIMAARMRTAAPRAVKAKNGKPAATHFKPPVAACPTTDSKMSAEQPKVRQNARKAAKTGVGGCVKIRGSTARC